MVPGIGARAAVPTGDPNAEEIDTVPAGGTVPRVALTITLSVPATRRCTLFGAMSVVSVGIATTLTVVEPTDTALPRPAIVQLPGVVGVQETDPIPVAPSVVCCEKEVAPEVRPIVTAWFFRVGAEMMMAWPTPTMPFGVAT